MIHKSQSDGLVTLTIDRPDKANALTAKMLASLADIMEAATSDVSVKAILLTGAGKVFSSGADLAEMGAGLSTDSVWERLSGAIAKCPVLTIAALNGTVAGGALGMVLACDLRIAVPTAKVFYPVMKLGFLPQPSDPTRLAQLVGPAKAKMIFLAGAVMTAEEALQFGLFDQLDESPVKAATALAQDVLAADRDHIAAIKALIR